MSFTGPIVLASSVSDDLPCARASSLKRIDEAQPGTPIPGLNSDNCPGASDTDYRNRIVTCNFTQPSGVRAPQLTAAWLVMLTELISMFARTYADESAREVVRP